MQNRFQKTKHFIITETKLEKKHYPIIIGLMIIALCYHLYIEPKTIGHDIRYSIYIFWLPILLGLVVLGVYRFKFLAIYFMAKRGVVLWIFMTFFYLLQGLLFSYLSFGQVAKMSWDYANFQKAKQNQNEVLRFDLIKIWSTKRSNYLNFKFNNKQETFNIKDQFRAKYIDENPRNYLVEISVRKGIWNYYLVNNWELKLK